MSRQTTVVVLLGLACVAAAADATKPPERQEAISPANELERLTWLEGLWQGTSGGVAMEELWTSVRGGTMLGLHRDVKDGRMVGFEFLRIQATPEGTVYFASPGSRPPVPFKLAELGDLRVVFENRAHDFPQRILYWLDRDGALHARIEGPQAGQTVAEEWVWTKAR
jgi:hypothetical protein